MVPRNNQLILFETYIQHQQFLITKTKISPSIQICKELKNRILQHLAKFHQNLMDRSEDINQNVDFGPKRGKFGLKRAQNGWG